MCEVFISRLFYIIYKCVLIVTYSTVSLTCELYTILFNCFNTRLVESTVESIREFYVFVL